MSKRKYNYNVVSDVTTTEVENDIQNNNVDMENVDDKIIDDVDDYQTKTSNSNSINKHRMCKIIKLISQTKAIIDFEGKGLIIDIGSDLSNLCDTVDIEYIGEIGKSDFKYGVIK